MAAEQRLRGPAEILETPHPPPRSFLNILTMKLSFSASGNIHINHKNYNFLACDWFKNVLFSTNSLAKLLLDSLLLDSLLLDSLLSDSLISQRCSLNQPITFKVVITCACKRSGFCVFASSLRMFTPPLSVFQCKFSPLIVT